MAPKQLRPLSQISNGERVSLVSIDAGHGLKTRLAAMGLLPGVEIAVVNNSHPGPFVVSVKNTKMILGRGMADKIIVQ